MTKVVMRRLQTRKREPKLSPGEEDSLQNIWKTMQKGQRAFGQSEWPMNKKQCYVKDTAKMMILMMHTSS